MHAELHEVSDAISRLRDVLQDLIVRGLRVCGPQQLGPLRALQIELARVGASNLEQRLQSLIATIESDADSAAAELLRTQAVLRVFERVLTIQFAELLLDAVEEIQ